MTRAGLPHSEMYGSLPACGSPYLFEAYRVLHRLSMPRHPPYALCSLITLLLNASPTKSHKIYASDFCKSMLS